MPSRTAPAGGPTAWATWAASRGTGATCAWPIPSASNSSGIGDAWKTAPVAWETCWDMRKWVDEGWSLRFIFNYALALHGSYINNKSAPLPAGENVRPEWSGSCGGWAIGWCSRSCSTRPTARPGEKLRLAMQVAEHRLGPLLPALSAGLPAEQRPRVTKSLRRRRHGQPLAARLDRAVHRRVLQAARATCRPARWRRSTTARAARRHAPGEYALSLAVVGEKTITPVVQFGIAGRGRRRLVSAEHDPRGAVTGRGIV